MIPTRRLALVAVLLAMVLFAYPGDAPGGIWGSLLLLNGALLSSIPPCYQESPKLSRTELA